MNEPKGFTQLFAEPPKLHIGDAVKRVTDKLGIKQCGGCKERQELLNKYGEKIGLILWKSWNEMKRMF